VTAQAPAGELTRINRHLPPIVQLAAGSLAAAVIGGIYMASYFPSRPPLGLPITLLIVGLLLLGTALIMLARIGDFGWRSFRVVGFWTLAAYILQAGMIGYAFVHNGASGAPRPSGRAPSTGRAVRAMITHVVTATSIPVQNLFTHCLPLC